MRLHLKINTTNQIVPFNHQHLLTGCIHKWLGRNTEHGSISLYSFSRLDGGRKAAKGLLFDNGSSFFFSSTNQDLIKRVVAGIQQDPEMFHGLKVTEIIMQNDPDFSSKEMFYLAAPVFIKRKNDSGKIDHIIYTHEKADEYLKESLLTKMQLAGIEDETLDIKFDRTYSKAGTKLISYKQIKNRTSMCPVIIKGKPETKAFAWNVGLGNSTGIGFGALK